MKNKKVDMSDAYVSVIMPAYNAEKTIGLAIQSVLDQTHYNFELLIINDASIDSTETIIKQYQMNDSRIRLLNNSPNKGVAESRNRGVREARFNWIAFIDSDDLWMPGKIEKQLRVAAVHNDKSLFYTGSAYINESNQRYDYFRQIPERVTLQELLKQNVISCSSVLVKKEMMLKFPMVSIPEIHEDFLSWLKILQVEPCAIGINEPLLLYRIHKNSKSGNKIHSAIMQWRTYRCFSVKRHNAIWYFGCYAVKNIVKYTKIRRAKT